jgi:hypothetical protein
LTNAQWLKNSQRKQQKNGGHTTNGKTFPENFSFEKKHRGGNMSYKHQGAEKVRIHSQNDADYLDNVKLNRRSQGQNRFGGDTSPSLGAPNRPRMRHFRRTFV